ncbi:MAG: helix-turn-helix domain-containing protein [Acidimicrobiia bacterium]|nr:helix-turn-helix domain-containing protein [Acidimicrobiia bacterium]
MTTMLTSRDVQDLINVDRSTIYRMAEQGRIPAIKVGRQWRFPADAVERWLLESAPEASSELAAAAATRNGDSIDLRNFLPRSAIQSAADLLADMLGVMVLITDMNGVPVTSVANPCGLFTVISTHPTAVASCIDGWRDYGSDADQMAAWRPSHFGFLCARSFIRLGGEIAGMVIVGGIAPDEWPPAQTDQAAIAAKVGVDTKVIADHVDEVHYLDHGRQQWVLDCLPRIGQMLTRFANERQHLVGRLEAIASIAASSPTIETERSRP